MGRQRMKAQDQDDLTLLSIQVYLITYDCLPIKLGWDVKYGMTIFIRNSLNENKVGKSKNCFS